MKLSLLNVVLYFLNLSKPLIWVAAFNVIVFGPVFEGELHIWYRTTASIGILVLGYLGYRFICYFDDKLEDLVSKLKAKDAKICVFANED